MGFFRRLFRSSKKPSSEPPDQNSKNNKKKPKKWSFVKSAYDEETRSFATPCHPNAFKSSSAYNSEPPLDATKHAIAVAAATAAVAEAALAAAHAAAEVVRLTSGCSTTQVGGHHRRYDAVLGAAIKIQSAFRGYLARRALRALKALVKLQALVRGYIVRKQTANMLKRMQTLVRLQAQARASRSHVTEPLHSTRNSSISHFRVEATSNRNEHLLRAHSSKFDGSSVLKRCGLNSNMRDTSDIDKSRVGSSWLDPWMEENLWAQQYNSPVTTLHIEDENSDKILEVDTWKPNLMSHQNNDRTYYDSPSKYSSREALILGSLKFPIRKEEAVSRTAENSPQVQSASSRPGSSSARKGPFTPTRSECSWGYFSGYPGHPNYMANTKSSMAKVRSQSAPRQRHELDKYDSTRRSSVKGFWDSWNHSDGSFSQGSESMNEGRPMAGHLTRLRSSTKLR